MNILRVRLQNFRNYEILDWTPGPGINMIVGDNAQGKTNLIESVIMAARTKSHRTRRDNEVIRYGQTEARVELQFLRESRESEISLNVRAQDKRLLFNGKPLARQSEIFSKLSLVLFAPEDLELVKEGPGYRRRWMDMLISQLHPAYLRLLQQYRQLMDQRNALLKKGRTAAVDPGLFSVYDFQMARAGAEIMKYRRAELKRVSEASALRYDGIAGEKERMEACYQPFSDDVSGDDESVIFERLQKSLTGDKLRGFTSQGPHRDDLRLTLDGRDVRLYASQGQQRSVVLSLKLTELDLLRSSMDESPVLMLDDVFSELDASRQQYLMASADGVQTMITGTSAGPLAKRLGYTSHEVKSGVLTKTDC